MEYSGRITGAGRAEEGAVSWQDTARPTFQPLLLTSLTHSPTRDHQLLVPFHGHTSRRKQRPGAGISAMGYLPPGFYMGAGIQLTTYASTASAH